MTGATTRVFKEARAENRAFIASGRDRVMSLVREHPGETTADIARETMVPTSTTYSLLSAAEKRGELRSVKANACRYWFPVEASA